MKEPKKTPTKHICAVKPQPPPVCDYLKLLVANGVLEIEGVQVQKWLSYLATFTLRSPTFTMTTFSLPLQSTRVIPSTAVDDAMRPPLRS